MSPLKRRKPPYPVIGQTIRYFRSEAELTQVELAHRVEIHPTEISRLESGKRNPKWETMKRLAKGLGVDCAEMVKFAEELDKKQSG